MLAHDDTTLADAVAEGDGRAADELFRRHRPAMYACALSVVRDPHDAEDAVQTAMARAMAAIPRDRPRRLRAWLLAIVRNEALMVLRARVPQEALSPDLPAAGSVDGTLALREEVAGLVVDLRGLPERQRSALVLRHLYDLSYRDVGRLLGIRPATARQAVLQARRSLIARAEARAQDCGEIRLLLAGDGRARRAVSVRAHLEACDACRAAHPATLTARIKALLPLPEPLVPPVLLRLLGGPGMNVRSGGAAAACLCTLVIGLGLVDRARRGGDDRPPAPGSPPAAAAADRDAPRAIAKAQRKARRVVAGTRPAERAVTITPVVAPVSAPAKSAPSAADPAVPAQDPPAVEPAAAAPEDDRRQITVEVLDDTSVTVDGYDLDMFVPNPGPLPVPLPVDPPGELPGGSPLLP